MRTLALALIGASVIAMGAVSAAGSATSEGVHGAGVSVQDPEFGSPGVVRLGVNVNRLASGDLVGEVVYNRTGFGQPDARVWAEPVFLLTSSNTACVVVDVDRVAGDIGSDVLVVQIEDDRGGGHDLYQVGIPFSSDPLETCGILGPGPDPQVLTQGNFTIFH